MHEMTATVQEVARNAEQLPITTLALNYSEGTKGPAQLFQFGLAAEDEAREVARRARADGLTRAGAMVPKGEWGERVLNAFRQEWVAHGGSVVGIEYIDQPVALAQQVGDLVQQRKNSSEPMQFLFLAATPQQAQQIKPTLNYQYASDLPVYATSHVFSASGNQDQYNDMNGVRFLKHPDWARRHRQNHSGPASRRTVDRSLPAWHSPTRPGPHQRPHAFAQLGHGVDQVFAVVYDQ